MGEDLSSRRRTVLVVLFMIAVMMLASCGASLDTDIDPDIDEDDTVIDDDAIITVVSPDGRARLEVPARALPDETDPEELRLVPLGELEVRPEGVASATGWQLFPEGLVLSETAILTFPLTVGELESGVSVVLVDDNEIEPLEIRELPADPGDDIPASVTELLDVMVVATGDFDQEIEVSVDLGHFSDVIVIRGPWFTSAILQPLPGAEFPAGDAVEVTTATRRTGVAEITVVTPDGDLEMVFVEEPWLVFSQVRGFVAVESGGLVAADPFRQDGTDETTASAVLECGVVGRGPVMARTGLVFTLDASRGAASVRSGFSGVQLSQTEVECVESVSAEPSTTPDGNSSPFSAESMYVADQGGSFGDVWNVESNTFLQELDLDGAARLVVHVFTARDGVTPILFFLRPGEPVDQAALEVYGFLPVGQVGFTAFAGGEFPTFGTQEGPAAMVPCPGGFIGTGSFPGEIADGDSLGWTWYSPASQLPSGSGLPPDSSFSMSKFFDSEPAPATVELTSSGDLVIGPAEAEIPSECLQDDAVSGLLDQLGAQLTAGG